MMQRIFSLSFHDLPYNLKSCFLYLSIFPEDYLIERTRVVRLWIAEGFVKVKDGRTLEEVAESYFYELLNRSLIQAATTTYDGRVKSCRIHDFLREAILSKSKDENFVQVLSRENATRLPEGTRRLSIFHLSQQVAMYQFKRSLLSKLRSLFFFGADSSLTMSELLSGGFKLLKVLDLQGAPLDKCPKQVSTLFLLRYLSFRNTKVSMLSKSIGNLHSLETLDLRQTNVTELPSEIYKLRKLRNLLICQFHSSGTKCALKVVKSGGCFVGYFIWSVCAFEASKEIGGLVSLQKLCYVDASERDDLIIELGKLVQLRRLCLINVKGQHGSVLCSSISKMQCLSSLSLHWKGPIDLQSMSSPPPLLKRLHLTGRLVELPSWLSSLQYLEVLHLVNSELKEDPLKSLPPGGCLIDLLLYDAFIGEVMFIQPGGCFTRLRFLGIFKFGSVSKLLIFPNAIPSLECVYIDGEDTAYDGRKGYIDDGEMSDWMPEKGWYQYAEKEFAHIVKPRT
ncbi:hypothetical protein L6164_001582 [Bauhinia variegata]|nr:hypothetical protein L6164_001582 [Bauhinia variegata]